MCLRASEIIALAPGSVPFQNVRGHLLSLPFLGDRIGGWGGLEQGAVRRRRLGSTRARLCGDERKHFTRGVGVCNKLNLNQGIDIFSRNCSTFQEAWVDPVSSLMKHMLSPHPAHVKTKPATFVWGVLSRLRVGVGTPWFCSFT